MLEPLDEHNLEDHLTAFADGELDAAQALAVSAYLAEHPDRLVALRRLRDHQRLTLAARRALDVPTPPALRDRIAALVTAQTSDDQPDAREEQRVIAPRPARRRIGYALAAAAGIVIGISAMGLLNRPKQLPPDVLPGDLVARVGRVHAECSRLPEALHNATFEATDAALAGTVKASLGSATAAPDLTGAGFRFVGAGPCPAAGIQTTHLLYRSETAPYVPAISLFVQPDVGQFASLDTNRVYRVSSPTSPFPTLAWRNDKVIYFLLADNERSSLAVLNMIHPTPADQIVTVASR